MPRQGLLLLLAVTGCAAGGGAAPAIATDLRELSQASGAPGIEAIVDLGGRDVPVNGELRVDAAASDGVGVIGEALWIRGRAFGRQPTVMVGGKPAAVLSRTEDGGILVRVPTATPVGPQPVRVTQEYGSVDRTFPLRRYALALLPGRDVVGVAEVGDAGPVAHASLAIPSGAHRSCMSADGRAAYVVGASGASISVVDLAAARGPRVMQRLDIAGGDAARALVCGTKAHVAVLVRARDVVLLDTSSPLRPARRAPVALPEAIAQAGVRAVQLSPDGRRLAFALESGNRVAFVALDRPSTVDGLPIEPDARLPVVADLAFAPDGATLWVLTGDTAKSRAGGPQPTRVHALRMTDAGASIARSVTIDAAAEPGRLSTGRLRPLASGAAIRLPPEKAPVYFSAGARDGRRFAVMTLQPDDHADLLVQADSPVGEADLTPDGRWLLAPTVDARAALHVRAVRADGRPGDVPAVELLPPGPAVPGAVPEVRIQP